MKRIGITLIALAFGVATTFTSAFIFYLMALIMTGGE